jgi:hypothetical protein
MKRLLGVSLVVAAAGALAASAAVAAPAAATRAHAASPTGEVDIGFAVNRFVKQGNRLVAPGRVVATYTDSTGVHQTTTQPFTAKVIAHGIRGLTVATTVCPVLYLELDKLSLTLLGLNVNLDKVILTINADSKGGALGSLFCELAHAKVKVRTLASTARRLTSVARQAGLTSLGSGLGFAVPLDTTATAATGTCPVLNLVLGPLNLKLLGLIVNLNQVHLTIDADPTGGVLGSLFCKLANTQIP